ncbi:hypothetical protein PFICI_08810 [Pestalotiopsis fici W106-1]|uniref:Uncharacterized protein n=1 Tax=Pestalotiopsis fici (strain W106-1 / CGMCC3.15140) TaxID=1229662 RepID=W3X0Q8_PESFW|nr:uncharacterized protein PFICI_08810 [Pestalotiopsis fici W106-1]ETS78957.1 hypothetical protein PFICI_08810 [Pestalotiopsis fici W106-1]
MMTRKELIRRFYSRLQSWQHRDVAVRKHGMAEIKKFLKNHPGCAQVWVDSVPEAHLTEEATMSLQLPRFLQSQLDTQAYFANAVRPSEQVCVTLRFAAAHLSTSQGCSFPTLFRGVENDDNQRSFCVFAYLDIEMASRKYSIAELMELKGANVSSVLLDKLNGNTDIRDVVRRNSTTKPHRPKRADDGTLSSSTDSEEQIVFKGKRLNRHPINNLDGETQWSYRGRNASERNSNEPIAAPTGLDAQQNEGFQRFFKAVVSPTHVRVTAGGRIVPNTRGTTSPSAKWDSERAGHESDSSDLTKKVNQSETVATHSISDQQPTPATVIPPMMLQPMAHPIYAGISPMYAPMPVFPMANGMPMPYGLPQSQLQSGSDVSSTPGLPFRSEKQDESQSRMANPVTDQEDQKTKPGPIKISPPEQFDQNRPYFLNGNVYYPGSGPLPVQGQPTPITPYFSGVPVHPSVTRIASTGQPSPMLPMSSPYGLMSPGFVPHVGAEVTNTPQSDAKSVATPRVTTTKTHMTSIKPSQITNSQLTTLRSQLKYFEDQLQYNKHQIDERATQDQVQSLRKTIESFEETYKRQIKFEQSMRSEDETIETTTGLTQGPPPVQVRTPSTPGFNKNFPIGTSHMDAARSTEQLHSQTMIDQLRQKSYADRRLRVGINCSRNTDTSEALGALEAHLIKSKKTSLPTRAAMAPIFEPKSETPSVQDPSDFTSVTDATLAVQSPWEQPKIPTPYLVGQLPVGMSVATARPSDYTYLRELSDEEKRARHVYWGGISVKGSGLPKFDGKDFYPPSPVKSLENSILTTRPDTTRRTEKSEDPFNMGQAMDISRTAKSTRKISHAVPIINPETMARENVDVTPKAGTNAGMRGNMDAEKLRKAVREKPQSSPTKTSMATVNEGMQAFNVRRGLDRSSKGSSNDLWQSMMKKGPTNGPATISSVSSMTANGYLPQFAGHAAASLSPAITNANNSLCNLPGMKADNDNATQQPKMEKMGENRPPTNHDEIIADLHKRVFREAEQRGLLNSTWH